MDVYDFDGTLYRGDSTRDFMLWCMRRFPRAALTMPRAGAAAAACFGLHVIDKTTFKTQLYRMVTRVPDIQREVERFWVAHEQNICGPCHAQPGDLVISASADFLLHDVCERRGLKLICSLVDPHTGAILSPNCSGTEKVTRFREVYGTTPIDHFYSDSRNDDPLATVAHEAYMVNIPKNSLTPWPSQA